ncbi:lymphocyte antigen 6 complex, locus G6C, isoform CRA_a [Mus musculus]|uniref:Lymphocyte antigen 6 family member G6C n=1 Tax=Mus musculus TaxID=10090 RepID=G3UXV4_MOUSE|nr:lymphocyte antigen 6 complex, locus G6C, isoform CRA_a [Mus musculus]
MKHLLLLTLSALLYCWVSADTRCHSCYKVPVLGCVDRQSCRLEPGHKCLTTNVYLGNTPSSLGREGRVGDDLFV